MLTYIAYEAWMYIQCFIICAGMDILVFLCIDMICKALLVGCRTLSEKRDIWLFESLTILGLSMVVLAYHHLPLLLWCLGIATFISATLTGRIDFSYYWEAVKNYWNEFSDQEENLQPLYGELKESKSSLEPVYKNQVSDDQCKEYLRQSGEVKISNENTVSTSSIGQGLKALRYNEQKAKYELAIPPSMPANLSSNKPNVNVRHRTSHKPLELVTSISAPSETRSKTNMLDNLETIGSKVWSVLGLPGAINKKSKLPPGLGSSGRNLCFLNSVLQCIARAPNLADELADEVKSCRLEDVNRLDLLDAVTETLQQINVMPSENSTPVVSTTILCQAGSQVNPDLLSGSKEYQIQQDACEFLTWLLYEIHEAINDVKNGKERSHHDESMRKLKAVYGNISESYTKVMKAECKDQIAKAEGITDPVLAEVVQNLSNLEWITHRRTNRSVIDDLFTFQCIELQMCSTCKHTSANVQTMNVLPIPVVNRDIEFSLSDCLHSFIVREKLFGREGLHCPKCQMYAEEKNLAVHTPRKLTKKLLSGVMSDKNTLLSPIQPLTDSGKHWFLSSTPLSGVGGTKQSALAMVSTTPTKVLTEGIRQSVLRRLPECLTIQLLRFNYDFETKKVRKLHTPVTIPLLDLDLSSVTYDSVVDREDMTGISKTHLYSLYAISVHIGGDSTNSGHYLSFCKGIDGCWYKFDDEKVNIIQDIHKELNSTMVKENCYLLFYRKQHENLP